MISSPAGASRSVTARLRLERPSRKTEFGTSTAGTPTGGDAAAAGSCGSVAPGPAVICCVLESNHVEAVGEALAERSHQVAARGDVVGGGEIMDGGRGRDPLPHVAHQI